MLNFCAFVEGKLKGFVSEDVRGVGFEGKGGEAAYN
jgi:hypothetical protein